MQLGVKPATDDEVQFAQIMEIKPIPREESVPFI
jgi:hypothetical protein